jgi:histidinol dehydrogenase
MMQLISYPEPQTWSRLLARPVMDMKTAFEAVEPIMEAVRLYGDKAVQEYTEKFDGVKPERLVYSEDQLKEGAQKISTTLAEAIQVAHRNIEAFHKTQLKQEEALETMPGVLCWRKAIPVDRVGLYVPGGSAPLFSTLLMLGIPARLAGCRQLVVCTPPDKQGQIHPAICYTALLLGIKEVYAVGGAQAIAAMTFGTATVPAVDKLFGPGNQYVTAAKQKAQAYGVAIDMPAGPSEVLVVADSGANPDWVAMDLLAQAEHGADSQVILLCTERSVMEAVADSVERLVLLLPRKEAAQKALSNSKAILLENKQQVLDCLNAYAPEHLILQVAEPEEWVAGIINAGSVFMGYHTPESAGDYASGTNHTLPTNGWARSYSGVSVDSFVKKVTFQRLTNEGVNNLGPHVEAMAAAEGLEAHRLAMKLRREGE